MRKKILENIKTLFYALVIALIIRSFFFQPFYIPSSSMEPNLLVGDRLFVSKYSYGYSRHSLPFSPKIYDGRIFEKWIIQIFEKDLLFQKIYVLVDEDTNNNILRNLLQGLLQRYLAQYF